MKNILATLLVLFPFSILSAQQISLNDVQNHMNSTVTVCGKVFNGVHLETVKNTPTLINMGGIFPNHQLTLLIWGENLKDFPAKPEQHYANKQVCVTGLVIEYKGKPEIVLKSSDQIQIQTETLANTANNITKGTPSKVPEKAATKTVEKTMPKAEVSHDDIRLSGDVKVRSLPSAAANVEFVVSKGSIVTFLNSSNGWSHISVKKAINNEALSGKEGYVKNDLLQGEIIPHNKQQSAVSQVPENTNVATAKSITAKPVNNSAVTQKPAVVPPTPTPAAASVADVKLAKDELKLTSSVAMRAGPSVDYKIISQVKAGTILTVLFSNNGWSQVIVKNGTDPATSEGYINNSSLH